MKSASRILFAISVAWFALHVDTYAQQPTSKVYWMVTTTVPLGKLPDYHAFAEKELYPVQEKHGYRFVAGWQTIVGDIEEVIAVAEFDNLDAYYKARVSLLGSEKWKTLSSRLDAYSRGTKTRLMSALPYITARSR